MKKSKSKKIKIAAASKLHLTGGILAVTLIAAAGVIALVSSFAASLTGILQLTVYDTNAGRGVAGVSVIISSATTGGVSCESPTSMIASTGSSGVVRFLKCTAPADYLLKAIPNLSQLGYRLNSGSAGPGTVFTMSDTTTTAVTVSVSPIDSDNDGTPDNTAGYPADSCPSVAGPGSNQGCPVAATPPPTPTPTPNTPAPTTTTTSGSSQSSSGSATKSGTTAAKATAPAVVVATSGDTTPPAAPENLSISKLGGGIFISWDESTDNTGIKGYNLDRSTDNKSWKSIAKDVSVSFYTDDDTNSSGHYYYRVQAVDNSGNLSEGTLGDIQLSQTSASNSGGSKPISPSAKKINTGLVAALSVGLVLVLAVIVVTFVLLRRRMLSSSEPYSYDIGGMAPPNMPTATVMPSNTPLPPQPGPAPQVYNVGQPAQHTSVSLKEMVMEEMNRHGPNQQGQPPMPPQPPTLQQ
jgi:hypothetical protein